MMGCVERIDHEFDRLGTIERGVRKYRTTHFADLSRLQIDLFGRFFKTFQQFF